MTISGKLITIQHDGVDFDCQLDATFEASADVTTSPACKGEGTASRVSVNSTSWTITLNGKTQTTKESTSKAQWQILDKLKSGELIEVGFVSSVNLASGEDSFVIEGNAVVTQLTIEAPNDAESTYSATFTGDGDWTKTLTPVV